MNALRHGLAAVAINGTVEPFDADAPSLLDQVSQRLRQIEIERAKVFNQIGNLLELTDPGTLEKRLQQLAALERYAERLHSKMKKRPD